MNLPDRLETAVFLQPELEDHRVFEVHPSIWDFTSKIVSGHVEDLGGNPYFSEICTPISSRLPFSKIVFAVVGEPYLFFLRESCEEIQVQTFVSGLVTVGSFVPGYPMKFPYWWPGVTVESQTLFMTIVLRIAFALALVNQPRIVLQSSGQSRQQRRAAARSGKYAVAAWTRVTWDISKPTVAKDTPDSDGHSMPLHWVRGYWRRALPHYQRAQIRPDAIKPEDRLGWWQWIEGTSRGHPAFGVKESIHTPRMGRAFAVVGVAA
jgi:hypothetical protein